MEQTNQRITYSFIIPHRNTPEFLKRCLASIPQRNDIEVIVVDNNSSPEIVDFEHFPGSERKDVLILRDNNSISGGGARNTGLAHANGKWVLFADADDYYSEGFLNTLDQYSESEIDVLYFNFNRIKDGVYLSLPYFIRKAEIAYRTGCEYIDYLKYRIMMPWNKMVNRSFILDNNISFEDILVGNDIFFTYQVGYLAKDISISSNYLYNYIANANSVSLAKKNSEDYFMCKYRHYYQNLRFYNFIGHPEWKKNFIVRLLVNLKKYGFRQFLIILKLLYVNRQLLKMTENDFVEVLLEKASKR